MQHLMHDLEQTDAAHWPHPQERPLTPAVLNVVQRGRQRIEK